ncbi:hypothetical protein FUA48_08710 [Flavobacterium alkalisoli]|uniref:Uncharacterized protein n=1 Tax=Flavobacterium alkalisoli TaxID=2602769 RepID=A0A5B9FXW2_9FLAO|nr:hypothetical protein [Flavobacterium alkalisoli]QEE49662.1 hypothetical protein FUA48_08710 [Flavobacterium alkalisoli]
MENIPGTDYNKGIVLYGNDHKKAIAKAKELAKYSTKPEKVLYLNSLETRKLFNNHFILNEIEDKDYLIITGLKTLQHLYAVASKVTGVFLVEPQNKPAYDYMFKQIIVILNTTPPPSPAELLELDPSTKRRFTFIECK